MRTWQVSRLAGPGVPPDLRPPPCLPYTQCVPTGVRTNLLTLQPALRTLTNDYNGLKRQVRGFPLLLQEALRGVKAEVSAASRCWAGLGEALGSRAEAASSSALLKSADKAPQTGAPLCQHTLPPSDPG